MKICSPELLRIAIFLETVVPKFFTNLIGLILRYLFLICSKIREVLSFEPLSIANTSTSALDLFTSINRLSRQKVTFQWTTTPCFDYLVQWLDVGYNLRTKNPSYFGQFLFLREGKSKYGVIIVMLSVYW